MKFTITRSQLQRGLARIQSIVEKRNTMPILANVLIEVSGSEDAGQMELSATDLEVGIRSTHPCTTFESGSVTASAKKLYEIVRELADEPIQIQISSNAYLTIRCARAEFTLAGTTADEYPTLPGFTSKKMATVQAAVLAEMIDRTMYAASVDETRYNLNGVFIEQQPDTGKVRMVATDGHRLAYADRALGTDLGDVANGVIIPRKGLAELKRLVDEEDSDEVQLGFRGNSGLARKGDVTLVMRLIEGEFPNYRQVIPNDMVHQLTLPTEPLVHALRRVSLLSAERSRAVKLELNDGHLALSSSNPDLGDAREELDVDYAGEAITIAFNARYLIDALGVASSKEVKLAFRDSLSPAQVQPADDEDSLAVVMPMRV
ncbi:MAG: DNA polymerase III subunit beta [Myxococcales bacterium]|nr:DNA polymerase III subunit beta [Myxococcales bacterium]MDH5565629.1 DNA polymerase III subunit beta [Myxococcales bacterium]